MRVRRARQSLRKLLVIEDDARLLASYCDLLSPYGFHVLTAPDGESAITVVQEHPDIQLVILDLMMPRMDGREWLRWYRALQRESPVILVTGYASTVDPEEMGLAAVLQKPFHVAELLDLVGLFCGLGTPAASIMI
ncbi:MAG: response regulator [Thermoanaerobaculia bacterium]